MKNVDFVTFMQFLTIFSQIVALQVDPTCKTLLHLHSHLIYKFQGSNCNVTYYGKTVGHLKFRAGKHIIMSALTGKKGSITTKNLLLKITCVPLMDLPS